MPKIKIKNTVYFDDDDNEEYCQPSRRGNYPQPQTKQSSFFIPIPIVVFGILAIPILFGMQRPMVISTPSNPVIVNTNNR